MRRFAFLLLVFPAFFLFADVTEPLPSEVFWSELVALLGGLGGLSGLAIVAAVVQLAMTFFRTSLADFSGEWKLAIVTGLSLVGAVLSNLVNGIPILEALFSGTVLAALQVFVHQIQRHLFPKSS